MTVTVEQTPLDRARNGAAFLDEHVPGWRDHVDKARLDMANPRCCVLGQLFDGGEFSGYIQGLSFFGMRESRAVRFGFYDIPNSDYTELQAAWEEVL